MSAISVIILIFSVIGAVDYLIGNKLGVGKEFARAFSLFAPMALSMIGMIVLAPAIGVWLTPVFTGFYNLFNIDPSIIPASLFANDMGGTALSQAVCVSKAMGDFNAYVVSSMMGCVISFTIPFSLGMVKREQHKEMFFGILCGIVTIPVGCIVAGLICRLDFVALLINLIPLVIISAILAVGLILVPGVCTRCFSVFGGVMKALSIIGLMLAVFTFLTKVEIDPNLDTLENGALVCANACVTLSGALPLMTIVARAVEKPLGRLAGKLRINSTSMVAFIGTLVTNASTFGVMEKMDKRGVVLNSAFTVSAAFVFGSHLAFTMAYTADYVLPMIVGKLISGVCAVALAALIYKEK